MTRYFQKSPQLSKKLLIKN